MATLLLFPLPLFQTEEAGLKILLVTFIPGSHSVHPSWWYQRMPHTSTGTPGSQTGWNGAEGRATREEGGHSPRAWFWAATWKRACVFITLPWPSRNLFWDSLTLLRSPCDSGGPFWPLYLGRRIPEKTGASLVLFVVPPNHSVSYGKICSLSCLPREQPMAGLPRRTQASPLGPALGFALRNLLVPLAHQLCPLPRLPFPPPRPPVSWAPARLGWAVPARGASVGSSRVCRSQWVLAGGGRVAGPALALCSDHWRQEMWEKRGRAAPGARWKDTRTPGRRLLSLQRNRWLVGPVRSGPRGPGLAGLESRRPHTKAALQAPGAPPGGGPAENSPGRPASRTSPRLRESAGPAAEARRPHAAGGARSPSGLLRPCPFWRLCNPVGKEAIHKPRSFPPWSKEASDCSFLLTGWEGVRSSHVRPWTWTLRMEAEICQLFGPAGSRGSKQNSWKIFWECVWTYWIWDGFQLSGEVRNAGSIPGSGRSPGGRHGNPPSPVFLPGDSHGQRSLAGYSW